MVESKADTSAGPRVLVIDGDELSLSLARNLEEEGLSVQRAYTLNQAKALLRSLRFSIVVSETALADGDGESLLRETPSVPKSPTVIFTAREPQVTQAVRTIRSGALDYLEKPYDPAALAKRIRGLIDSRQADRPASRPSEPADRSAAMVAVAEQMKRLAGSSVPVLVTGAHGSGKKTLARRLHRMSARAHSPFVELRCDGLSGSDGDGLLFGGATCSRADDEPETWPGALEQAAEGSLFLSRIEETPPAAQVKLTRVLDEGGFYRSGGKRVFIPFRARLISSTELPMAELRRRVDPDLLYRLAIVEVEAPLLRNRLEDMEDLVRSLLAECAAELGCDPLPLDPDALAAARLHDWPGNVQELRARLLRGLSLAKGKAVTAFDMFPEAGRVVNIEAKPSLNAKATVRNLDEARAAAEREQIIRTLASTEGRVGDAARMLGISRVTLWMKMKRLGLQQGPERVRVEQASV